MNGRAPGIILPPEGQQPGAVGADRQLVGDDLGDAALRVEGVYDLQFTLLH